MTETLNILASCRSPETAAKIGEMASDIGIARVEVRNGAISDLLQNMGRLRRSDALIVDLDLAKDEDLEGLNMIIDRCPTGFPVIATSANTSVERIRLLMRLGVADFLPQPITRQDLTNSIMVMHAKLAHNDAGKSRVGTVVGMMRAAGGMGATTIAVQTAYALAQSNEKHNVCLIDLDLEGGSIALHLDLPSALGVQDCLSNPSQIDATLIKSVMTRHKAGFNVLTAPETIMDTQGIAPEAVQTMLDTVREDHDLIIVDTPPVWTPWVRALYANCDLLCLVTHLTVTGVRHARRQIDALETYGLGEIPRLIAVNRYERQLLGERVRAKDAERLLNQSIDAFIPDDAKVVSEALNAGVPVPEIRRRSDFVKNTNLLVDKIRAVSARRPDMARA